MKFFTTSKISDNIRETPEGYLVCVGVSIARTGEMEYGPNETPLEVGPNGKVIVSRDADEVFRPETIASFQAKALTIQHPSDFVSPENWSSLSKGILQNVRRGTGDQANDLVADLLITESTAINLVKNGLREVSCGYEAEYIQTGIGRGVQKNIIGNHLALVQEGRAGSAYAINDHKGKGSVMTIAEKIKSIFAKAQDEAIKAAETKDDLGSVGAASTTPMTPGYDELMKAIKDGFASMAPKQDKPKDASTQPTENAPAEVVAKDDTVAPGLEDRLTKLEAAMSKLLEGMSTGDADSDEDEGEMVGDDGDDDDGDADTGDADSDEDDDDKTSDTGDCASRVEILAPGMKATGKDVKAKALKVAYATTDGKAVIDQFTSGKAPDFKNEKFVDVLFTATSEILKSTRAKELSKTRTHDFQSQLGQPVGAMTPEKINELNAKHYASRTTH